MNNNTFVHKYVRTLITKDDICVDMTAGNGNDTVFLASLAKHVYAFDISEEAIRNTSERIEGYGNVTLINDDHASIDRYDIGKVRLFIFNLGYLPHGDDLSCTKPESSLQAFQKAYEMLEKNGYIVITFYLGHPGGKDEYYLLDSYIKKSDISVMERYRQDKPDSPVTYIIRKL
ncbi:MAG: class I SAM-dependent methyltransferase [Erysipelotrichaceae bacterium]|nr:class I SAM-dependent methyltransferase [Erysipelotrichaceae bacterium]